MNRSLTEKRFSNRGFTLLELLTVIGIMTILAALLFPTFSSAREKGRQAACITQLHQIGVALQIYRDNNGGIFPWYLVDPSDNEKGFHPLNAGTALEPYTKKNKEIFWCPSDLYRRSFKGGYAEAWGGGGENEEEYHRNTSYAYHGNYFWRTTRSRINPSETRFEYGRRVYAERFIIAACEWHRKSKRTMAIDPDHPLYDRSTDPRQRDLALRVDGSVKTFLWPSAENGIDWEVGVYRTMQN